MTKLKLRQLSIAGFKSISSEGQLLDFEDLTVLLGANGSGKSNLISFFKLLNYLVSDNLQLYIGQNGSAVSLLFHGPKRTSNIKASLVFSDGVQKDTYSISLAYASGDTLIFEEEKIEWSRSAAEFPQIVALGQGHKESAILRSGNAGAARTLKVIHAILSGCRVYQFHDTGSASKIRSKGYINDVGYLRDDAGNLAAYLYAMKSNEKTLPYYHRIVQQIRLVMPQFHDFQLAPSEVNPEYIRLDWTSKYDIDYLFGPHQLSDGSLRFMALATLLLQPPDRLPGVIVIDEPELGLHPSAISALAGMIHTVIPSSQVILATQSMLLVDEFEVDNIIVMDMDMDSEGSSVVKP